MDPFFTIFLIICGFAFFCAFVIWACHFYLKYSNSTVPITNDSSPNNPTGRVYAYSDYIEHRNAHRNATRRVEIRYDYPETHTVHSRNRVPQNPVRTQSRHQPGGTADIGSYEQKEYEKRKTVVECRVRELQLSMLEHRFKNQAISTSRPGIIVGVDATPRKIGGYFINTIEHCGEFYSFPVTKLPWSLATPKDRSGNPAEFEMKNLMFALYLWEREISSGTELIHVYTDNNDYNTRRTKYGVKVRRLIHHLKNCVGIRIQVMVRGTADPYIEEHARFVKAADDFSRGQFLEGIDFLVNYYLIERENFMGSHQLDHNGRQYRRCGMARQQLEKVKKNHAKYKIGGCRKCNFEELSPSLQSIVIDPYSYYE